jgi:hypothetical protein
MPQKRYADWLLCLAMLLFIAPVMACRETDPRSLFTGCVTAGTMYMEPDQTTEITCDLKADTLLVALPSDTPSADELVRNSVPRLAAEMLAGNEQAGSRWCFLSARQSTKRSTSECVDSQPVIERLFVARGRNFRVTLMRVGDAPVSVTKVRASEDASQ